MHENEYTSAQPPPPSCPDLAHGVSIAEYRETLFVCLFVYPRDSCSVSQRRRVSPQRQTICVVSILADHQILHLYIYIHMLGVCSVAILSLTLTTAARRPAWLRPFSPEIVENEALNASPSLKPSARNKSCLVNVTSGCSRYVSVFSQNSAPPPPPPPPPPVGVPSRKKHGRS